MHQVVFFTNVLRIMRERGLSNKRLSDISGVSNSFISGISKGKGNPSLRIMEQIAVALETPLPLLLESTDLGPKEEEELFGGRSPSSLPPGYERVCAVLPNRKAFIVRQWHAQARLALRELENPEVKHGR